jgi:hypothetical protein
MTKYFKEKSLHILMCLLFSGLFFGAVNAKPFKGIVPLKSTRADVVKQFGEPDASGDYRISGGKMHVYYSEEPCGNESVCECLVKKDVVLKVEVYIHNKLRLKALKLDNLR